MKNVYIGTSGYSYATWKDKFYPPRLPSAKLLEFYGGRFNSIELNQTFTRFPVVKNLRKLYFSTPYDFAFSVKVHQLITHTLRAKNAADKVVEFTHIVEDSLRDKFHCLLFQFPPTFIYSEENLHNLLESIPRGRRNVVEFRNASWWNSDVFKALREQDITFCNVNFPGLPETYEYTTANFYLRMHGNPEIFISKYDEIELVKVAQALPDNAGKKYIFFNNTMQEGGYTNAGFLQSLTKTPA